MMELTEGAALIKEHLDGYKLNSTLYGHALRYVLYYIAGNEGEFDITEAHLADVCKDGVEIAKKL